MFPRFGRRRRKGQQEPAEERPPSAAERENAPDAPEGPQPSEASEADEPAHPTAGEAPSVAERPPLGESEGLCADAAGRAASTSSSSPEGTSLDQLPVLSTLLRLHGAEDSASLAVAAAQLARTCLGGTHLLVLLAGKSGSFRLQAVNSAATGTVVKQLNDALGIDLVGLSSPPRQGQMANIWLNDTASAHIVSLADLWGDLAGADACQRAEKALGISQVAALRLASADEPLGIALFLSYGNPPDPAMLDAVGRHLTVALANLRSVEKARQFGSVDPIRWIADHGEFSRQLTREVNRARRYGHPVSVALLVVDNFDTMRLEYGWTAANRLLRAASSALAEALRESDVLGSYRHNGFGVILVQTPAEAASLAAGRLCEKAAAVRVLEGEGGPVPECVATTVTYPEDGADTTALLVTAESRLRPQRYPSPASA